MAKFPTYEQMAKDIAEKTLDEFLYEGKTIREWVKIIAEQEPILDKLRAEIIENSIEDYKYHGCGTDELIIETSEVLQIIDKYREQEPKTGHWNKGYTFPDGEYWKCTKCKELIKVKYPMKYCNNCGSKNE